MAYLFLYGAKRLSGATCASWDFTAFNVLISSFPPGIAMDVSFAMATLWRLQILR